MKKIYLLLMVLGIVNAGWGQVSTWTGTTSTTWLTAGNWSPSGAPSGVSAEAFFNVNTNAGTNGINLNGISAGNSSIGAIHWGASATTARTVTNSSGTIAGTFTLNGLTINSLANTILRNASTGTHAVNNGGAGFILGLGNVTDNVIAIDGTGGINIGAVISGSSRKLTKAGSGSGVLTLSGANTYSGGTVITSGILRFGAAGVLADGGAVTLNGGTLNSGATTGFNETMGTLALLENSTIALGTGSHTLTFAASNAVSWTSAKVLTITGWTGTVSAGTTGTAGKIFVGANSSGLTTAQLAQIKFTISGVDYAAAILSTGEVVPVLKYAVTNISPASPTAGVGFDVTVQSQDFNGNLVNVITTTSNFTLSTNGAAGTIGGTTTGSITNGTNATTVTGVTLSSAGSGATITATWASGDVLAPGTSASFTVLSGSSPSITITGTPLSAFSTNAGTPSTAQFYNVSGSNLTDDITITAPTGYEIKSPSTSYGSSVVLTQSGGTVTSTQIDVRLNSSTAGTFNGNITHVSTGATTQNVAVNGTVGLDAPTANAPTVFTATSFTANWGAITGATAGYLLDASAYSTFSAAGALASEGFENALALFTETTGTGTYSTGNSLGTESPANSPFASAGTYAYGKSNGSVTITSSNINTAAASSVQMSFRLASFSINTAGNGADGPDIVTVEISPDGGTTYYSTVRVLGNANAVWPYSATGVASTAYDGDVTPVNFQPAGGGLRTTDGYSTVNVTGLPSVSNLRVRITLLNDNANERWLIDDLSVIGTTGSYLPGYNGLAVAGTSQAVTVPGPGTYYYRVRATTGSVTSANSNVVSVVMNDQNTAAFRSTTTGDYSNSGTWEFNVSPPSYYAAATQAPGSSNAVTVHLGHTVTLTGNASANGLAILTSSFLNLNGNTLSVSGNMTNGGALVTNSGTVDFTATSGTQTLTSGGTGLGKTFHILNHTGAGTLQLVTNNLRVMNAFNNNAGPFDGNGLNVLLEGNLSANGTYTPGAGTLNFNGTAGQTWSGAGANNYGDVVINKAAGNVSLNSNVQVSNLTLTAGKVVLGTNNLTVTTAASGGSSASYVVTDGSGKLTVNNIGASSKLLPIGNSTYNPLSIANGSGHNWSVKVTDALVNVQPPYNTDKAVIRTWSITPSVNPPSAGADLTFQYDDGDPSQLGASFNTAEAVQLWHYGVAWIAASGALTPTGTAGGVRTITRTGWSQYSDFAIANISGPLPVSLASFSGYRDGSRNQLRWTTATELNNLGFDVQRSTDGVNYVSIGFVNSLALNGNSSDAISYAFTDNAPAGTRQYYRLLQTDIGGQGKWSNVVLIRGSKPSGLLVETMFPNPARNTVNLLLAAPGKDKITIMVTNMAGQTVLQKVVSVETGSNTVPLDISLLQSGSYAVRVICSDGCEATGRFVKQ